MLRVSVVKRRPGFTLAAAFAAPTPGVIGLFGRSGSGKSTLIDTIAGLLPPDEGEVQLAASVLTDTRSGIAVPPERRRIGYVFQDSRLFPHLSVAGNLRYGEKRARSIFHYIRFEELLELLGLGPLLERRPHELSGGERQPQLLLLDEPLASLDLARREEVLPYLERLRDWLSIPMVYVSHQFEEVLRLATYLVLLENGRVLAAGPVGEMSLRPELRTVLAPDLVGAVLDGLVTAVDAAGGTVELAVGSGRLQVSLRDVAAGARVRVQLLARDIILATQPVHSLSVRNALRGTVVEITPEEAASVLVRVDVGGPVLLARITEAARRALGLSPGDAVWVLVKAVSTRGHAFRLFGAPARAS